MYKRMTQNSIDNERRKTSLSLLWHNPFMQKIVNSKLISAICSLLAVSEALTFLCTGLWLYNMDKPMGKMLNNHADNNQGQLSVPRSSRPSTL